MPYILLHSLFLFGIGENIKLKFLCEENNCLWQPASQSVWRYLYDLVFLEENMTCAVLSIHTHLHSVTLSSAASPSHT